MSHYLDHLHNNLLYIATGNKKPLQVTAQVAAQGPTCCMDTCRFCLFLIGIRVDVSLGGNVSWLSEFVVKIGYWKLVAVSC
jgi:hypothetical protein